MTKKRSTQMGIIGALCFSLLIACDSRVENITGPFILVTIDIEDQTSIAYKDSKSTSVDIIPPTVFSIGFDSKYIVAKQHPNGNKKLINYWYFDMTKYHGYSDTKASVGGPFSEQEFAKVKTKLGLPNFNRTIKWLE